MNLSPSRAAALSHLSDFLPAAGRRYADTRNHDDGPGADGVRSNVSQLSPWLHAGLIGEPEVIDAVLGEHSAKTAEKFIAEVFWRIYFKGYLEQRPAIWADYCAGRDAALAALERNAGIRTAYAEATEGRTGIAAFDLWAQELVATGYLHNHARMWFASIWIFTLKLDWRLGADFFLRHLMDGDAASNTSIAAPWWPRACRKRTSSGTGCSAAGRTPQPPRSGTPWRKPSDWSCGPR